MTNAIEARGLRKSFGGNAVLDGVDLSVERGTVLALLGPNGAGKTTTVRILSTLLVPDGGTASVDGFDVVGEPDQVRRRIGLTGQDTSVDGLLTGRENLVLMGRLFHLGKAAARERADALLAQFGLSDAADRAAGEYSGGMRRRLDLAASLIPAPPVLFLDEPTTGLDPTSREAMWETVRELVAGGTTVLLTTQYLEEADQLADRIVVLSDGRVAAEGTAPELKRLVGRERLELTFAAAVVRDRAHAFTGGDAVGDTVLSIPVDGIAEVRSLLNRVQDDGLSGVSLHQPTLDDVFRTLTTGATR